MLYDNKKWCAMYVSAQEDEESGYTKNVCPSVGKEVLSAYAMERKGSWG